MIPLFEHCPALQPQLPHTPLGEWTVPVERLQALEETRGLLGLTSLWIKRDDLSGDVYGGNKVRKLEFLLAEAQRRGCTEVLTYGFAGSNHALATAIYSHRLGMRSISMLLPQENATSVRRNLLASFAHEAELHHYRGFPEIAAGTVWQMLRHAVARGRFPMLIPAGGTNVLGVAGFVNAFLELAAQVEAGACPLPNVIYTPLGSCGTAVGLQMGARLLGLDTTIVPVRVIPELYANAKGMAALHAKVVKQWQRWAPAFRNLETSAGFAIREGVLGPGYGQYTQAGVEAAAMLREAAGIQLDGTYTAKAFAALIEDAREGKLDGKHVLFWHTYNGRDLSRVTEGIDYHRLPRAFHRYFETPVQELDGPLRGQSGGREGEAA